MADDLDEPTRTGDSEAAARPTVSIVVPVKNDAANLRQVLPELPSVHEVILVDGGSVDGTVDAARKALPGVRVIQQTRTGKGNAVACGLAAATGDILVMFDGDGSADPAEIPLFVDALVSGAGFAKGSRLAKSRNDSMTLLRRCGNAGLRLATAVALRARVSDLDYGYNALWRRLLPVLELPSVDLAPPVGRMLWGDGFEIETVITCRMAAAGVRITEVPSVERRRFHGATHVRTFGDETRVLRTLVTEGRRRRHQQPQVQLIDDELTNEEMLEGDQERPDSYEDRGGLGATA